MLRKHPLSVALFAVIIGAAIGALVAFDRVDRSSSAEPEAVTEFPRGDLRHADALGRSVGLRDLPRTALRIDRDGEAVVARTDVPSLIATSKLVFVGRPVARGGSEEVTPAGFAEPEAPAATAHRIRFEVAKVLRGGDTEAVDLMVLDITDEFDRFDLGRDYLIFAEERALGSSQTPALVPTGYQQGVFRMESNERATNDPNGSLDLTLLRHQLKEAK